MSMFGDVLKTALYEITVEVLLRTGVHESFSIVTPQSSGFIAKAETPTDLPADLAARYAEIPLKSRDILAANDELRTLLERRLGDVSPSHFWYDLSTPTEEIILVIRDVDPVEHRLISIGGCEPSLNEKDKRSVAFAQAITTSGLNERDPYWVKEELHVKLKSACVDPTSRLETFDTLVGLF